MRRLSARLGLLWVLQGVAMMDASQAATASSLEVSVRREGAAGQDDLLFTWRNLGASPLLLLTHADTDAGIMFDAIEIWQGAVHAPLKSPRKAVALRFCVLPAGRSHTLRIAQLTPWLQRIGLDPARPWQAVYRVDGHVKATESSTLVCGADADTAPASAPLWYGQAKAALLSP